MLTQIVSVTLDGSGYGLVRLPQAPPFKRWEYSNIAVSISTGEVSAVTGGEARLYLGEPSPGNFITGTRTPWLDNATLPPGASILVSPQYYTVEFTNCDPGAVATVQALFDIISL